VSAGAFTSYGMTDGLTSIGASVEGIGRGVETSCSIGEGMGSTCGAGKEVWAGKSYSSSACS